MTIHNGGTLEPGSPGTPSTMTITGNLVFQSGATDLVQIGPGGAVYDHSKALVRRGEAQRRPGMLRR